MKGRSGFRVVAKRAPEDKARKRTKSEEGNALKSLVAHRVDAVDEPATGSPFLVFKNTDDPEEIIEDAKTLVTAVQKSVEALCKDTRLTLSGDTAEVLQSMAGLVGISADFDEVVDDGADDGTAEKKAPTGTAGKADKNIPPKGGKKMKAAGKTPGDDDEGEEDEGDDDEVETLTASETRIVKALAAIMKKDQPRENVKMKAAGRSRQLPLANDGDEDADTGTAKVVAKSGKRELGAGLFESVLFPN